MTRHILIILTILLSACGRESSNKKKADIDSTKTNFHTSIANENNVKNETTDYNNATYFIIVADTSQDYSTLHKKMFEINRKLDIPIDSMGRYYNKTKNLIALPDNDKDEIYAGDYFPRRFPSNNLSLEYLDFYQRQAGNKTIALVAGIYEAEKSADSSITKLKKIEKKAFKIKAEIYIGCTH